MWEAGRDACWDGLFFILGLHENVSTRDNYIHTYVRTYVRTYIHLSKLPLRGCSAIIHRVQHNIVHCITI